MVEVTKEVYKQNMLEDVFPTIKAMWPGGPGDVFVQHILLIDVLHYLHHRRHHRRHHRTRSPVPAVPLGLYRPGEREDADLLAEIPVDYLVSARPPDGCKKLFMCDSCYNLCTGSS